MAIGLAFLMVTLLVQTAMLVVARTSAEAATAQAARRASFADMDIDIETSLVETLLATVPGAREVSVSIHDEGSVTVISRVEWTPPGPDFLGLTFTVSASAGRIEAP
ncbi:MAG: hypothetical protein KJO84_00770 [Acidimicrobiia bacterium]|nr:hypothetical protein [Acidimicrobiia bacterium]